MEKSTFGYLFNKNRSFTGMFLQIKITPLCFVNTKYFLLLGMFKKRE